MEKYKKIRHPQIYLDPPACSAQNGNQTESSMHFVEQKCKLLLLEYKENKE